MNVETKYSLGQVLWGIEQSYKVVSIICVDCEGEAQIQYHGVSYECRRCHGKGSTGNKSVGLCWSPATRLPEGGMVGRIEVLLYSPGTSGYTSRTAYMLEPTGVGSGTSWAEDNLFPTEEEAGFACVMRNELLEKESE